MNSKAFGRWAFEQRTAREESLATVARRAGLSASGLRKIELAEASPTLETVAKICRALEVDCGEALREIYG